MSEPVSDEVFLDWLHRAVEMSKREGTGVSSFVLTVPISPNSPILLVWTSDNDTVHVEAFGQAFDGMSWDDFISRIDYLQREREKHQGEAEGGSRRE